MTFTPSLNPKLILGIVMVEGKRHGVPLEWKENNGILIAGLSGSGKSQTASLYLNQYANQGVQLIVCDYDSPIEEEEALSERVKHLQDAFYLPPAKTPEEIKHRLEYLNNEYRHRVEDPTRRFPLLLVIDEVSAFLSYIKEDSGNAIEDFARNLLQMRKVGIRSMIIGQEWSSGFSTQLMRPIRSAFRVKVIHQLDAPNVKMLLDFPTADIARRIGQQRTGFAYYSDYFMAIPLLSDKAKRQTARKLREMYPPPVITPTQPDTVEDTLLEDLIARENERVPRIYENGYADAGFDPSIEDLVLYWYLRGHSKHQIVNKLVKGTASKISGIYDRITNETL